MKKVRQEGEKHFIHGRFLEPMVLRYDGRDSISSDKPDKYAIFFCFPYLTLQATSTTMWSNDGSLHQIMGLLQSHYHMEDTRDRDKQQIIQKANKYRNDIIHVAHLWGLVLSSGNTHHRNVSRAISRPISSES